MAQAPDTRVRLRLYVAGNAPNSQQALFNLNALCSENTAYRYDLEVIDVLVEPHRALDDGVLLTPSLVVGSGTFSRVIVGTLNETRVVRDALGLTGFTM